MAASVRGFSTGNVTGRGAGAGAGAAEATDTIAAIAKLAMATSFMVKIVKNTVTWSLLKLREVCLTVGVCDEPMNDDINF